MASAFMIAAMASLGVGSLAYGIRSNQRRRTAFIREASALLEDVVASDREIVRGKLRGRDIAISQTTRGHIKSPFWTEIEASLGDTPIQLTLKPQSLLTSARAVVAKSADVNVVEDPAFDGAFIVDGAPAAAVRQVLGSADLRQRLLALAPIEVVQTPSLLRIVKRGQVASSIMGSMLFTVVDLATRMEQPTYDGGAPYRGGGGDVGAELEALERLGEREQRPGSGCWSSGSLRSLSRRLSRSGSNRPCGRVEADG
jgi:hypothetical protein